MTFRPGDSFIQARCDECLTREAVYFRPRLNEYLCEECYDKTCEQITEEEEQRNDRD